MLKPVKALAKRRKKGRDTDPEAALDHGSITSADLGDEAIHYEDEFGRRVTHDPAEDEEDD